MKLISRKPPSKQVGIKSVRNTKTLFAPATEFAVGAAVEIGFWGGETITGQVWALAPKGFAWVASPFGWYAVEVKSGYISAVEGGWHIGREVGRALSSMEAIEEVLAA